MFVNKRVDFCHADKVSETGIKLAIFLPHSVKQPSYGIAFYSKT
jgi:hypothetical protein